MDAFNAMGVGYDPVQYSTGQFSAQQPALGFGQNTMNMGIGSLTSNVGGQPMGAMGGTPYGTSQDIFRGAPSNAAFINNQAPSFGFNGFPQTAPWYNNFLATAQQLPQFAAPNSAGIGMFFNPMFGRS